MTGTCNRCIILKELNKKKIYTVTTDYEPINGNEIVRGSTVESNQYSENRSNGSRVRLGEGEVLLEPDALENHDFGSDGFAESKAGTNVLDARNVKSAKGIPESNESKKSKPFKKLTFVSQGQVQVQGAEPKIPESRQKPKLKFNSNP